MATLNLTANDFADIGMMWLFDQVMNPEQIQNENMKDFVEKHSSKIKSPLMKYYLDSSSEHRLKYRRIKGVFDGSTQAVQQIRIGPNEKIDKIKKKKDGLTKKIIKKILKKEELTLEDEQFLKEIIDVNLEIYDEG